MAGHVDCYILEVVQAATGVEFDTEVMAKERLRLPARMKGGGIQLATDTKYPAFLGALLDIMPRCVDTKENNGEITKGICYDQMTTVIGVGAFDEAGHMNTQFMETTTVGPYPKEIQGVGCFKGRGGNQLRLPGRNSKGRAKGDDGATRGANACDGQETRSGRTEEGEKNGGLRRGTRWDVSGRSEGKGDET